MPPHTSDIKALSDDRANKSVRKVQGYEILRALHNCHQGALSVSITIDTAACMEMYHGVPRSIESTTRWTCAIDGDTIVYIRDADIAAAYVVETEAEDGRSLSLQSFDQNGRMVAALGGGDCGTSCSRWNHLLEGISDF